MNVFIFMRDLLAREIWWHISSHEGRTANRGHPGDVIHVTRRMLGDVVDFCVDVM